jgi:hypothetical protein
VLPSASPDANGDKIVNCLTIVHSGTDASFMDVGSMWPEVNSVVLVLTSSVNHIWGLELTKKYKLTEFCTHCFRLARVPKLILTSVCCQLCHYPGSPGTFASRAAKKVWSQYQPSLATPEKLVSANYNKATKTWTFPGTDIRVRSFAIVSAYPTRTPDRTGPRTRGSLLAHMVGRVCDGFSYRKKFRRSDWRRPHQNSVSRVSSNSGGFCAAKTGFDGRSSVVLVRFCSNFLKAPGISSYKRNRTFGRAM